MANTVIGALSVEISVDSKGVKDGLKASGEALEVGGKQLREGANKWGKWAVAAVAATAAVTAAIVKTNLTNIRELKNAATAADETVESFQRGAFAAEQFGVSQEKYGDILKDVNDRVGDFLITGAGPMVDFFEQIAPKVDITADSFKNLSGSQSLGLYVESLQKAGASQQEMTFFMEALAGDATRLIPLFEDNAKAFNALTFEAKALGIGLSAIDVEKAEMASKSIAKSLAVTEAFGQELTVQLAPIIGSVIDLFEEMAKEAGGASQFTQKAIGGVIDVVGVFADGLQGTVIIFKALEIAALGFSALAVNVFTVVATALARSLDSQTQMINDAVGAINSIYETGIKPIPKTEDSEFIKGLNETADGMIQILSKANGELDKLMMTPLSSDRIKNFVDASIGDYERLAKAKVEVDNLKPAKKAEAPGTTGGAAEGEEAKRLREENKAILATLIERGNIESTTMEESFARQQEILNDALANNLITKSEHLNAMAALDGDSDAVRMREENEQILAALISQGDMRVETLFERLEREQAVLDEALAKKQITEETYANASLALDERIGQSKRQVASATLNALATIMAIGGKKAQKVAQGFAIASAVIDGQTAAVSAYMHGTKIGGPVLGGVFAAASVVKTAGMIASIKSGSKSSSGGGGGVPNVSSGGSGGGVSNVSSSSNSSITGSNGAANIPETRNISINLTGEGLMSTDQVRDLIGQINEATNDGVQLITNGV